MIDWSVALGTLFAFAGTQAPTLTLDDALRIAQSNAYSVKIAESAIARAKASVAEANANRGPKASVNANYTRFDKALTSGQGTIRPIDSKGANLTVTYPIDLGGSLNRFARAAQYVYFASQDSFQAELGTVRLNVRQAFFVAQQTQQQVAVFEDSLRVASERLKNLRAQLAQGQVARVDVLRGETQESQAQADLLRAQNAQALAKQSLNNALSRPIETEFTLEPLSELPTVDADEKTLADLAGENRYELRALRHQSESFNQLVLAAKGAKLPTVNVQLQHARNFGQQGFSSSAQSSTGTLAFSVSLWDGGSTSAKVAQAKEDSRQLLYRYEQSTLSISLEVRQALTNLRNAKARIEVADKQTRSAEENLRLATLKTDNGEGIQLEIIDAQNQLTSARAQRVTAQADYLIAYAQLQRAVGNDQLSHNPKEKP